MRRFVQLQLCFAHRGHLLRCLAVYQTVFVFAFRSSRTFQFCVSRTSSLSHPQQRRLYLCANSVSASPIFPLLLLSSSLLRPFRFLASALTFISFRATSTLPLSRQLRSHPRRRHQQTSWLYRKSRLDYYESWLEKLEDSPIGAAERFRSSSSSCPFPLPLPVSLNFALAPFPAPRPPFLFTRLYLPQPS